MDFLINAGYNKCEYSRIVIIIHLYEYKMAIYIESKHSIEILDIL